jgi:hypothetical protein
MVTRVNTMDRDRLVAQIDALMRELTVLRRQLSQSAEPSTPNLTRQLYGSLGHGTWEEYDIFSEGIGDARH